MSQHHQTWSLSLKMSHYVISTLKLLFTELCIYKKLEHHKLAKIRFLYTFNTIKHGGRGGSSSKCPRHFKMFVAAAGAYQWPAILAPQKRSLKKMTPPWLSMTPIFFITESVSPIKMWMFAKNQSSKSLFLTVLRQF